MRQIRYFIAMNSSMFSFLKKIERTNGESISHFHNLNKKDMRFHKKVPNGYFHHGDLLIAAQGLKSTIKEGKTFRESLGITKNDDVTVFVDSGGYSLASGALSRDEWTDEDAFNVSIMNGDIFPILDVPIVGNGDFDKCLKYSCDSAVYYKANKPGNGEIILNVAQGRNQSEFKKWVDAISKTQLDGWAMGSSHKGNSKEIIKSMFFMLTSGVLKDSKAFHVFGVSSAEINIYLAAIKYALRANEELRFNFDITFDSSSPLRAAAFMQYFMYMKDNGFSSSTFTNRVDWNQLQGHKFEDGIWCDCPVCSTITDFPSMMNYAARNESSLESVMWCSYHNFYVLKQYISKVSALVELCYVLPGLTENMFPPKIARNIQTIYEAFSNIACGEEIINRKFEATDIFDGSASLEDFFN